MMHPREISQGSVEHGGVPAHYAVDGDCSNTFKVLVDCYEMQFLQVFRPSNAENESGQMTEWVKMGLLGGLVIGKSQVPKDWISEWFHIFRIVGDDLILVA